MTSVASTLLTRFAGDPTVDETFEDEAWYVGSPVDSELEDFLASLDPDVLEETKEDEDFLALNQQQTNLDRAARIWVALRVLRDAIARYRIRSLYDDSASERPRPYDVSALEDLDVDSDNLVPLAELHFNGSGIQRNGHAFQLMSTTPAPNSTYWLLLACHTQPLRGTVRVRLDPLLHGPVASFPSVRYRMLGYGNEKLDWQRIANLTKPEHGQWRPDNIDQWSARTDWVWEPRGPEIHFRCEGNPFARRGQEGAKQVSACHLPSFGGFSHPPRWRSSHLLTRRASRPPQQETP